MNDSEPNWGDPPIGEVVARLLAQRHPPAPGDALAVDVGEGEPDGEGDRFVELLVRARRHRYRFRVKYLRGAGPDRDPWMLMVDALDALYGSFVENGRSYRELPTGSDVAFDGAFFSVEIEHSVPELEKLADQLLGGDVTPRES